VIAAGQEVTKGRSKKEVAQEVIDFVVKEIKGKLNDAEIARVAYRNHTVNCGITWMPFQAKRTSWRKS